MKFNFSFGSFRKLPSTLILLLVDTVLYDFLVALLDLNLGNAVRFWKKFLYAVSKFLSACCNAIESTSFKNGNNSSLSATSSLAWVL